MIDQVVWHTFLEWNLLTVKLLLKFIWFLFNGFWWLMMEEIEQQQNVFWGNWYFFCDTWKGISFKEYYNAMLQ